MKEERFEQLELPFPKTNQNPAEKKVVDQVTECMKVLPVIVEGRFTCSACGGSFASNQMYRHHYTLPRGRE